MILFFGKSGSVYAVDAQNDFSDKELAALK